MDIEAKTGDAAPARPKWRTPTLAEDSIVDVTMNVTLTPGSDGLDGFPGYTTTGPS